MNNIERYEFEEFQRQIHEELTREKFRQALIKNDIASDYATEFRDNFPEGPRNWNVQGMVYVYKQNNIWNVMEINDEGEEINLKRFIYQEDAYIDAGKRRYIEFKKEDFQYDITDIEDILTTIRSAKLYLRNIIDYYKLNDCNKINKRIQLLCLIENQIINSDNYNNQLIKKRGGK